MKLWDNFKRMFSKNRDSNNGTKHFVGNLKGKLSYNLSERPVHCIKILSEEACLKDILEKLSCFDTSKLTSKEKATWNKFVRLIKTAIENQNAAEEARLMEQTATLHAEPKAKVGSTSKTGKKHKSKAAAKKSGSRNVSQKKPAGKAKTSKVKSIPKIKK